MTTRNCCAARRDPRPKTGGPRTRVFRRAPGGSPTSRRSPWDFGSYGRTGRPTSQPSENSGTTTSHRSWRTCRTAWRKGEEYLVLWLHPKEPSSRPSERLPWKETRIAVFAAARIVYVSGPKAHDSRALNGFCRNYFTLNWAGHPTPGTQCSVPELPWTYNVAVKGNRTLSSRFYQVPRPGIYPRRDPRGSHCERPRAPSASAITGPSKQRKANQWKMASDPQSMAVVEKHDQFAGQPGSRTRRNADGGGHRRY